MRFLFRSRFTLFVAGCALVVVAGGYLALSELSAADDSRALRTPVASTPAARQPGTWKKLDSGVQPRSRDELSLTARNAATVSDPSPTTAPSAPRATVLPGKQVVPGKSPAQPIGTAPAKAAGAATGVATGTAGVKPLKGKRSDVPFDAIKEHGEFFVGWPKPRLALVITGREDGYFEPCGCAGLDRMKGGLSRRYTMLEDLRKTRGWPTVAVDVGGLIKGWGRQAQLKLQMTIGAMRKMNYDAIGLGKAELKLPAGELVSHVASIDGKESPFVSANVDLYGLTPKKRIVEAGGMRLGITSILGKKAQAEINNPEVTISDPDKAIQQVLGELQKEKCNLLILLAHATVEESVELAKKFPQFGVVVTAGGPPLPPHDRPQVVGRTLLVEVGEKGMNAIVLGVFDDPKEPVKYQRVVLDSRYKSAAGHHGRTGSLPGCAEEDGTGRARRAAETESAFRPGDFRGLGPMRIVPRRVVQGVEEIKTFQGLRDAGASRARRAISIPSALVAT